MAEEEAMARQRNDEDKLAYFEEAEARLHRLSAAAAGKLESTGQSHDDQRAIRDSDKLSRLQMAE